MVGVDKISTSRGNINSLPIVARIQGMSVSSIGALFHEYWLVLAFLIKLS